MPPIRPMLAKSVSILPEGMLYEPKWDGFRCIVFRDGDEVELGSRKERPLTRYFPEIVEAARTQPPRCVVDGEIVIASGPGLDFEALLQRIHPAASRVNLLATQTPAWLIAFDLLAIGDESLMERPWPSAGPPWRRPWPVRASPCSRPRSPTPCARPSAGSRCSRAPASTGSWPSPRTCPTGRTSGSCSRSSTSGPPTAWSPASAGAQVGPVVGSLLLGLYDEEQRLQHVGVSASFSMERRRELLDELAPYRLPEGAEHPWTGYSTPSGSPGPWSRAGTPRRT